MFAEKIKGESDNISLGEFLSPSDVLLVVSPLCGINLPLLGIHLLQASCRDAGVDTKVLYSNLIYSNLIGVDLHKTLSEDSHILLKERIFAVAAFGIDSVSIGRAMHKFADPAWIPDHVWKAKQNIKDPQFPQPVVSFREWLCNVDIKYLESLTNSWLHALARQIVNIGFRIVGCSTTFGGLVPALALLDCVKKADPEVITIMGGALCEAEMAEGLLSLNAGIDYIFSGEGEITFPTLVKQILEGRLPGKKIIRGEEVIDLDTLPLPDYQDYIEQIKKIYPHWLSSKKAFGLAYETSRGCSFGKCTFCELSGKRNVYRSKSPDVIIRNLKSLIERYGINFIVMTDRMMPVQYFDTLLSRLSTEIPSIKIFYHTMTNMTLDQVVSLKKAGITEFQPGIESLSPSLLRRMHKHHKVRNVFALLRYARSVGVKLKWNLLFGLPGDQNSEYEEMLQLIPLIHHLQPPTRMIPMVLCRFSKYQTSPENFRISNLRPAEVFKEVLPSHADLAKICYWFTADFSSQSREIPAIITALWEEWQDWRSSWDAYQAIPLDIMLPKLQVIRKTTDRYVLEDTRGLPGQPKRMEIDREQASLLLVARPLAAALDIGWALDAGLGAAIDSQFIPLATAEPALLQELEREFERD